MTYEVEQKFRVVNLSEIEQTISALGCELGPKVAQCDIYFSHPTRDFRTTDELLRLRSDSEGNFLTYKGPRLDSTTKTRRELEITLPKGASSSNEFAELWRLLGFNVLLAVRKTRRTAAFAWHTIPF